MTQHALEFLTSFNQELMEHPPQTSGLCPLDNHLFGPTKQLFHSNENVEMVVHQCQWRPKPNFHSEGNFKCVKRRGQMLRSAWGLLQ